jgi:hypothetical protein
MKKLSIETQLAISSFQAVASAERLLARRTTELSRRSANVPEDERADYFTETEAIREKYERQP